MNYKLIKNDCLKNKFTTLIIVLFIAAASMLVSLVAILSVNLSGAIDTLMKKAETPHFMQMHSSKGQSEDNADFKRLNSFANQNQSVDSFQVLEFLNIDNSSIQLGENMLSNNSQDNGFSVQSKKFDYLLDLNGDVVSVADGELYVPICYMRDNTAKLGDKAIICGKEFTIAGFLRDSQMNSMLSSSKRFLVSDNDYAMLKTLGRVEYLIEFRLKDISELSLFESVYTSQQLPSNGPTITYPLFKMINAMSDGMMIGVILLVSILVVIIALLCIRFTLLAKIEEEYKEIGVMKAIGLRNINIKQIYLFKYMAIGTVGCILGFLLSFLFKDMLTKNIRLTMGESDNSSIGGILGFVGVLAVLIVIFAFVSAILRRFRKISVVEAIRFGVSKDKHSGAKHFSLSKTVFLNTNIFIGIKDIFVRKGIYTTMLVVIVLSAFIMIVPQNLYSTISDENFTTYMGIGKCDLRLDIQQTDNIPEKVSEIESAISTDTGISKYTILTTKSFKIKTSDDTVESIKIELGNHQVFPVTYSNGKALTESNEIALSSINADELSKKVGDTITLLTSDGEKNLTVCGIYSDITNGGKTAKAVFTDSSADTMWSIFYISLNNDEAIQNKATEYQNNFSFAKVTNTEEYVTQTYGQTLTAVKQASMASIAVAIIVIMLVTLLFMKMLIAKDRYNIAVTKACGFTNADIMAQYISRSAFVLILGVIIGTVLANTAGEAIAGMVISSFGASSFKFTVNPMWAYIICPLVIAVLVLLSTIAGTISIRKIKISDNIKE